MKVLIAGAGQHEIYEKACADSLKRLGHEVSTVTWGARIGGLSERIAEGVPHRGLVANLFNRDLRLAAVETGPDLILLWRPTLVFPQTIRWLKRNTKSKVVSYNNDDPFNCPPPGIRGLRFRLLWRYYLAGIRETDLVFVYRAANQVEAREMGARRTEVLMPYYVPDIHHPVALSPREEALFRSEVTFIGHFEPDSRGPQLLALADAGLSVRVYAGPTWDPWLRANAATARLDVRPPVVGSAYAKAIAGSSVCLAFLSKQNRDTYTRRSFEIPACGGLMLSEMTPDLLSLYTEGIEALFFANTDELLEKALYAARDSASHGIADAGRRRAAGSGYDIDSRMTEMVLYCEALW